MSDGEVRVFVRAALILLVSGVLRWSYEVTRAPPPPAPVASDLERLDSAARRAAADDARRSAPLAPGERIDPNRAPEAELDRLPGVGPAVAGALVEHREREGPFARAADLTAVRGIGPATVARLEPWLDFSRPPGLAGRRESGPQGRAAARPPRIAASPAPGEGAVVDVNRAGVEELQTLPGVGPALARRIVESRARDGPFRTRDDLARVRGIGPVLVERLGPRTGLPGG